MPQFNDLVEHFANASTPIYQGIPLISGLVKLSPAYNHSQHKDLLKFAILSAWMKENPELKNNIFYVSLSDNIDDDDDESKTTTLPTTTARYRRGLMATSLSRLASIEDTKSSMPSVNVRYFVGVNEKEFDVSEVQKPSASALQVEMRQHLPSGVLFQDLFIGHTDNGKGDDSILDNNSDSLDADASVSLDFYAIREDMIFLILIFILN